MLRKAWMGLCVSIFVSVAAQEEPQEGNTPGNKEAAPSEQVALKAVQAWELGVRNGDLEKVRENLSDKAKVIPEYAGGDEALEFWRDELEGDLDKQGFAGKWTMRVGRDEDGREVIFVFPLLSDGASREAIWCVREGDSWKIERLFLRPPRD